MEIKISGLKCDICGWRDDSITFEEYVMYENTPCPICDNIILTEYEYKKCLKIYKLVDNYNKLINILKWFNPFYYIMLIFKNKTSSYKISIEWPFSNKQNEEKI